MKQAKKGLIYLVQFYQSAISPYLRPRCRFVPSCSDYVKEALESHGILKGTGLGLCRLLRCQPLAKGGYDPVPLKSSCACGGEQQG